MNHSPRSRIVFFVVVFLTLFSIGRTSADDIDPRGVFYHSYTGPFSAVEWVHIRSKPGIDRYEFSDIRALAPYYGSISNAGSIVWDNTGNTSGTGTFTSADNATMTLNYFGGIYDSTLTRAPGTDADFVTQIESRTAGNVAYNGRWDLVIDDLDPVTGALISSRTTSAEIAVLFDLVRITYDDGTFYQGVFEEADRAGFRVVLPDSGLPAGFSSFTGSETSLQLDLLGSLHFESNRSFAASWLTQTRNAPGQHLHTIQRVRASRIPEPVAASVLAGLSLVLGGRRKKAR
ncbi:MAG: hypothetical protein AAF456_21745 [Planctomycetota bacterium]